MLGKEMQRLSGINSRYEETIATWQERYNDKQEEIIKLKQEVSMKEI